MDLQIDENYELELSLIKNADLVFIDGPKNSRFEQKMIPKLIKDMKLNSILVIDDIRFFNMVEIWENINQPKIDLADFGHISGTGIVFIQK